MYMYLPNCAPVNVSDKPTVKWSIAAHTYQRIEAVDWPTHSLQLPDLFPVLCEEDLNGPVTQVTVEHHPTTHAVSIGTCRAERSSNSALVVQLAVVGMVTTAVPVPSRHAGHRVPSLTNTDTDGGLLSMVQDLVLEERERRKEGGRESGRRKGRGGEGREGGREGG